MKVLSHKRKNLEQCKEEIDLWELNLPEKKQLKIFLTEYISGRITGKRATNVDGLVESTKNLLKISLNQIKNLSSVNEIKKFYDNLFSDKIKSSRKKPFSLKHKVEIIHCLKRYLIWRFPKKTKLSALLNIKVSFKKVEPEFLTIKQIDNLYSNCKNNKERYIIAGLFSTGARIEEFLNLRLCDYDLSGNFPKVTIRETTSKTKGRTISLYWNNCFKAISEYFKELRNQNKKDTDYILDTSYSSLIKWLYRFRKKCKIDKHIHPHLFRDSSATWLASKLNRQQLCIYFGWDFSSPMPDRYIARAGVNMTDLDEKIKTENLEELKTELDKKIFDRDLQIEEQNKKIEELYKSIEQMHKSNAKQELSVLSKFSPKVAKQLKKEWEEAIKS